ncbi:hypothetical protein AX15_005388 [Amanita polypyramis BW_CC]|nr:hypothetical protein AX15_005388 [Amanita polypyramis BW_CC]
MLNDEPDVSSSYFSHFRVHLAQVQAHLAGETKDVLPPSLVEPAGYWASSEKNAFFHALARYSRLRPDLIAAHIKTKSVVDVRAYIDRLETASKANPISWTRKNIDIAFEVSDSWVEFEEWNASSMSVAELLWGDERCRASRQAEIDKRHADTPDGFNDWTREAEAQWNREDTLRRLDTLQLNVLESILRVEDLSYSSVSIEQDSKTVTQEACLGLGTTVTEAIDNVNIEPRGDHIQPAAQTPILPAAADQTSTQTEQVLSSAAPRDGLTPDILASQSEPGFLSPASRRRLYKRLYMRRKRAEQSGREMNLAASKLRPGRETTGMRNPRPKKYNTKRSREGTAESHTEEVFLKSHRPSGMTRYYKIRQHFAEQEIDPGELRKSGLDLFHLSMLGRLMELYKSGYEQAGADVIKSISADTIRLLRTITIDFMTELIHRAIVFKNQEVRRKGEIKVWVHRQKEISADAIHSCLEMMGLDNLTKEAYFEQLLGNSDAFSTDDDEAEEIVATDVNEPMDHAPVTIMLTLEGYRDNVSVMQVEADERGLKKELEEEEELDELDTALMQQNEVELWTEVT